MRYKDDRNSDCNCDNDDILLYEVICIFLIIAGAISMVSILSSLKLLY